MFGCAQVTYRAGAAEALADMFAPESFDLIVSLETIEHVLDPKELLRCFRRLLAPGGAIVVSCPNDWWYYPTEQEKNPFHLRKYTFNEFQQLSEQVLGPACAWFFGAPVAGFANVQIAGLAQASPSDTQGIMLNALDLPGGLTLPAEAQRAPNPNNVSYFLGMWCEEAVAPPAGTWHGAALLSASMDALVQGFFAQIASQIEALRQELQVTRHATVSVESKGLDLDEALRITRQMLEVERATARSKDQQHENQLRLEHEAAARCRQEAEQAQRDQEVADRRYRQLETHAHLLELEARRYRRVRNLLPGGLRRRLMPLARRVLNMVRRVVR
ncbi:hypothetical protein GCM10019059_43080 [Camelimonas fluminis]|nr:hypothetical protein GCM10019059_43080 [Camelimonas fluminis]